MAAAQLGIARIGFERVGELVGVAAVDQRAGDSPSRTRLVAPVASAATTGSAQAIASSVTLPNASVIDGLKKHVGAGERAREIGRRSAGR